MQIDREILEAAVARGDLTRAQAGALLDEAIRRRLAAQQRPPLEPPGWRSLAGSVAAAMGAGVALAEAFDRLGFLGLAGLASALALALLAAGWQRVTRSGGQRGQVLISAAVLVVPLAAHGVARALGLGSPFTARPDDLHAWLGGPWFPVQAAAALAAALALRTFRIPFLVAPLAVAAWFAAQDAAPLLFGQDPTWVQRVMVSALAGLVLLAAGVSVEGRARGDLAFWLYLPGLLAFSGGLMTWTGASNASLVLVALLHAGLVLASLVLGRRGFAVAGALGLAASAGRLADDLLEPTALSFALAGVALAVVGLGLLYHLHEARLAALVHARLPQGLQRLLPPAG